MAGAPAAGRTFSLLVHADQWARCAHERTALLPDGTIELTWLDDDAGAGEGAGLGTGTACGVAAADPGGTAPPADTPDRQAGLAFDTACRAYRSRPQRGLVEVLPPGAGGRRGTPAGGDASRGVLERPTGLAVDRRDRLYVAETGGSAVRVVDLRGDRLLRRLVVPGRPVDVAPDCGRALVLVRGGAGRGGQVRGPGRLLLLDGRRGARPGPELVRPRCPGRTTPRRLTGYAPGGSGGGTGGGTGGGPLVLWRARDGRAVIARPDGTVLLEADGATDLDLGPDGRLVVGVGAGRPIRDFRLQDGRVVEAEPLRAPGFDGDAVAIAPDGRVAFTTAHGYAWTAGSAALRATEGRVVTYRLDSQAYRTRWGRVFLDACLPAGTSLALRFITSDADDVLDPIAATPPERGARDVPAPQATPPQAPAHLLQRAREGRARPPFRRPGGSEQPWPPPRGNRLATYELPVQADPGRYLWIEFDLTGTGRLSPTVGGVRVERPGHALLNALPLAWSRDEGDAAFLHRLLAPAEGLLHELDLRADGRGALVNPQRTPSEALIWLASFAALTLDRRWPETARRALVAQAYPLFRRRGTLECLVQLMELYLGVRPSLIETWRLRGLAGAVLGSRPSPVPAESVGGSGSHTAALGRFAVGGRDSRDVAGGRGPAARPVGSVGAPGTVAPLSTGYDATAHRFTVLVPGTLGAEQRAVLGDLLDEHRPAHTVVELCELGAGMRIGSSLRLDLTAYVGPAAPAADAVVGRAGLGVDGVLGVPATGSRLAAGARVGQVRVG